MDVSEADSYWSRLCDLVLRLRCWVRVGFREGAETYPGYWGTMLLIPTTGYLEAAGGPTPIREVEWVDVSTVRFEGGKFGRPLKFIAIEDELLRGLRETDLQIELVNTTWSFNDVFEDEPSKLLE